jgi:carboxyl-terminal processing protease
MTLRFRSLFALFLTVLFGASAWARPAQVAVSDLYPDPRQVKTTVVINKVLERYHYRKMTLDDKFAAQILKNYLTALDPNRSFFLQRDVARFEGGVRRLDDNLKEGKLDTAFDIFRVYRKQVDERVAYALTLLDKGFDFSERDDYPFDRSKAPWAKNEAELDEIWRKRVKNDFLSLRLADKDDAKIREQLRKRYEGLALRVDQFASDDVFQTFANAYTEALEPHTSYMSPSTSENFDISMRLSLEGIGAVLRSDNEFTTVQRTIPGGPARESGLVHADDRIVGVAQGLDGLMEDVVGWRLQDVVDKIRGPKGSVVRLQLLQPSTGSDSRPREVSLVRNEIKLEDQAAKSYLIETAKTGKIRIGVVEVPAFYRDFRAESDGEQDFRSTTRDVRGLIDDLKRKGVDGIVVDLRGNGGGSLAEATSLTGLFIDTGPVVQVKDAFGKVEVEEDPDPGVAYTGPLAVVVDRDSASASEIFAGAIQDYGRGLILGEPTFGKGTVQTLVDLNRYVPGDEDNLGRLRLTMAEFFRISGGSTQLKGVVPDIQFPTAGDVSKHGERALENALPWGSIRAAQYTAVGSNDVRNLQRTSSERISRDPGFQMLLARNRVLSELDDQKVVSLREQDRRVETKRREKVLEDDKNAFLRSHGITPVDPDAEHPDEEVLDKERDAIGRIQIDEAARILAEAIRMRSPATTPKAAMRD